MSYGNYLKIELQDHLWRDTPYSPPATVYLALHTADPTAEDNTATELTIGDGAYARLAIATSNAAWTAPALSGGRVVTANVDTLTFPEATADWAAGAPITHFSLRDAATGGNLLRYGALGETRIILDGDTFVAAPGSLQLYD